VRILLDVPLAGECHEGPAHARLRPSADAGELGERDAVGPVTGEYADEVQQHERPLDALRPRGARRLVRGVSDGPRCRPASSVTVVGTRVRRSIRVGVGAHTSHDVVVAAAPQWSTIWTANPPNGLTRPIGSLKIGVPFRADEENGQ